jgi:hypothetical protein
LGEALLIEAAEATAALGVDGAVVEALETGDLLHDRTGVRVLADVLRATAALALRRELTELPVQLVLLSGYETQQEQEAETADESFHFRYIIAPVV